MERYDQIEKKAREGGAEVHQLTFHHAR
jgi:hypothetical protein